MNPSDVSSISLCASRDALCKSVNPWIGFDHQQRAGDSCMSLQPWQPKEPRLNVYKGRSLGSSTSQLHHTLHHKSPEHPAKLTLTAATTMFNDEQQHDVVGLIRYHC